MVWDTMLKWFLLSQQAEEPPIMTEQFLEPWTWESVDFGDIKCRFVEEWSS